MRGLVVDAFEKVSSEHRNRVAVCALSEHLTRTFGGLADDARTLHRALDALRLPPNPTIVSNVGNRMGLIPLFVASLGRGSSFIPLDGGASAREVFDLADAYSADLIVMPSESGDGDAWRGVEFAPLPCGLSAIRRKPAGGQVWRAPGETDALILKVTSGSTGLSKAAVTSELSLINDGRHVIEVMGIGSRDIGAATVPMAHAYGMSCLLLPLVLTGSAIVTRDRFVAAQWAQDVSERGVTVFPGVPFIFDYLRRAEAVAAPLRDIRLVVTAGAPIQFETLRYFKDRFGVKIHSLYGTTETGSVTFDASDALNDPVSLGWPVPETTVTLNRTGDMESEGRVHIRGSAVSRGYVFSDVDDESAPRFTADGFLTSDLGRLADDGQLVLMGRMSGFVNVAGRKVSPGEVERIIAELPEVAHVWVLGIADGARGQELVACVSRRDGALSAASIRTHCAAILSPHKVPRRIVFADDLPVTSRGKVTRQAVEALLRTDEGQRQRV